VAVYARQSVEDATSDFGSIDAQREAVSAYVASQREKGWTVLPAAYEDGGFSGKNTARPAFQRLLADVDAGHVDVIAVYKLHRLSRSLSDFVQLMARFRERGVEFVSITQHFDTTTSSGRMVINLLATFGEYEREQISERTRDKMRAARRHGMWTGGAVPLGYTLLDKKLIPDGADVENVRWLYETYLAQGSLTRTIDAATKRGLLAKNGKPLTKNTLRHVLAKPGVRREAKRRRRGRRRPARSHSRREPVGSCERAATREPQRWRRADSQSVRRVAARAAPLRGVRLAHAPDRWWGPRVLRVPPLAEGVRERLPRQPRARRRHRDRRRRTHPRDRARPRVGRGDARRCQRRAHRSHP